MLLSHVYRYRLAILCRISSRTASGGVTRKGSAVPANAAPGHVRGDFRGSVVEIRCPYVSIGCYWIRRYAAISPPLPPYLKGGYFPHAIRKAVYHDLSGELHKELIVHEVREVDVEKHRSRPVHMSMHNRQNKRRSVMKVDRIHLRKDIPDDYFTTRYLERQ